MSPALSVTRQTLAEFWRLQLEETQAHYHRAQERYGRLLDEQRPGTPHGASGALTLAREAESEALSEYARVLRIFKDLILNGKVPEEHAAVIDREAYEISFRQHLNR